MRLLRATFLPLIALSGVALLAWGVASWWTFYRDLYVEEESALQALADEVGGVRYRRQGDFEQNGRRKHASDFDETPAIDVPWSVPYVGRVEYVDANDYGGMGYVQNRGPSSQAARDRALSLPGLRGYHECALNSNDPEGVSPKDLPLGRPLPDLHEPQLTDAELDQAVDSFPESDELSARDRASLAKAIAESWSSTGSRAGRLTRRIEIETPSERSERTHEEVTLSDGARRLWVALRPPKQSYRRDWRANVVLIDDQTLWEFQLSNGSGALRHVAPIDLAEEALPNFWSPTALGVPAEFHHEFDPATWSPDFLIGEAGEKIVSVGRVDARRLAIEAQDERRNGDARFQQRFRAVVREDLDYAIERWEFARFYSDPFRPGPELRQKDVEIRRIERVAGDPCVVESYLDRFEAVSSPLRDYVRESRKRTLVATVTDPAYSSAALDPATYDPSVPQPRELPLLRGYRVLWVAGGLTCLSAAVGFLIQTLHRRSSRSRGAPSPARRRRIRFGLASVVAVTLLVIGAAGWIKERIDQTQEESILLRDLLEENSVEFRRAEPNFPWAFVSTDAFPIGAPLTAVEAMFPPKPALLNRLLERSPPIRFTVDRYGYDDFDSISVAAAEALDPSLPQFADVVSPSTEPIPRGQPLPSDEAMRFFDEASAAWSEAQARGPTRYLLRVESSYPEINEKFALRDGERYWDLRQFEITTFDGRFRRRFFKEYGEEWLLYGRESADDPLTQADDDYPAPPPRVDELRIDDLPTPIEFPLAPFALPAELRSYWTQFEQIRRGEDAQVTVERLDANRFLLEVREGRHVGDDPKAVREVRWTLVARRDLDWCVEACDVVEAYSQEDRSFSASRYDPFADPVDPGDDAETDDTESPIFVDAERAIRCRTLLRSMGGQVFPVQTEYALFNGPKDNPVELQSECVRMAVDMEPAIDDRIFSRPTLDSPPPVEPRVDGSFRWYGAAFALGVALLAFGPLRAAAKRLAGMGRKLGDDSVRNAA